MAIAGKTIKPPAPPKIDFDWSETQWREAGARFIELAAAASTGWDHRRPAPPPSTDVRAAARPPLGDGQADLEDLLQRLADDLLPAAAFNGHPRFFAYITSSPSPPGVLADMLASALNQNVGAWRLAGAATAIELQTIDWIKEIVGYPRDAEGVFLSGGQMANVVAYNVFRDLKLPWDVRKYGLRGPDGNAARPRIYTSAEAHYCHEHAAELLGFGRDAVRHVPIDDAYRMRIDALVAMIAEDRANGDLPIAIAATAGTVGTGAIDPIEQISAVAQSNNLWLHVDGAYGAFAAISADASPDLRAMSLADSIACDPHKWLYAPIDAGVTLVRRPGELERVFAFHPAYLAMDGASDRVDMYERGPENSRRFRALKVWLALQLYGRDGYREMIEYNIALAEYMEQLIESTPGLALAAPRGLSIVCWRVEPPGLTDPERLDRLQTDVIATLEERGIAVVSNAQLADGRMAIRACIVNFRTSAEDAEALVRASAEIGRELAGV